jgi:hypothetical protein
MSETSQLPYPSQPDDLSSDHGTAAAAPLAASLLAAVAVLAGSALIGLAGGFAWAGLAPRVVYVVVGRGAADVVNVETTAFIAGDAWYCLIGGIGGLIIGAVGYLLAVRRYGPLPMAAVLAGSVGAGCLALWVGQWSGRAKFYSQLLTSHQGALLHAPLVLGGSTDIAFWPLAACLVAGALVLAVRSPRPSPRQRFPRRSAARQARPGP